MKLLLMGLGAVMRSEGDGGGGSAAAQELGLAQTSVIISSAKFDSEEAASGWAQTLSEEGRSDRFRPANWGKAAVELLPEDDRPDQGFNHFDEATDREGEVEITGYNALYGVVPDGDGAGGVEQEALSGAEYFPLVQGGITKRASVGLLDTFAATGGTQSAYSVFAGPSSGSAGPCRALAAQD